MFSDGSQDFLYRCSSCDPSFGVPLEQKTPPSNLSDVGIHELPPRYRNYIENRYNLSYTSFEGDAVERSSPAMKKRTVSWPSWAALGVLALSIAWRPLSRNRPWNLMPRYFRSLVDKAEKYAVSVYPELRRTYGSSMIQWAGIKGDIESRWAWISEFLSFLRYMKANLRFVTRQNHWVEAFGCAVKWGSLLRIL